MPVTIHFDCGLITKNSAFLELSSIFNRGFHGDWWGPLLMAHKH